MLHVPPLGLTKMQRAYGRGECVVKLRDGKTALDRLWQEGCSKLRLPRHDHGFEVVMINSSGGLTGGDDLKWAFCAADRTAMTVTTQACEKVYASSGGAASVSTSLSVGAGARLNWLPQETILFNQSALSRNLNADLAVDAELLLCEPMLLGREAMNETVVSGLFEDRWRIRMDGRLIHAEQFRLGPDVAAQAARTAVLNGARAFASVLLIGADGEALLDNTRAIIGDQGGVSFWNGKFLARLIAKDGYELRQRLIPLLSLLNKRAALPKCWTL
ncbi:MAG: urease accessory protein UreD [Rhizobiaceae bacterium]